ncbi:MAG: transglycosylase [Hyphomicrobiaceae bacterium]|nr:MAG: transglycosylase [Hyphomicrobiaceae bacterium]
MNQAGAQATPGPKDARPISKYERVEFGAIPGWSADDHAKALKAFRISCRRLGELARNPAKDSKFRPDPRILGICGALAELPAKVKPEAARHFFERYFDPHKVTHSGPDGLLTGYFEPIVEGSRIADDRFKTPVYRRPADLVDVVDESNRGTKNGIFTHLRQTVAGLVPFATRDEIDKGALKDQQLELLYLEDPVEVFFVQIQGSARVRLRDGKIVRVGYDGKNGHPYSSIGRYLIDKGEIPVERMSLDALRVWLKANPEKAREAMWANKSYVFFREHPEKNGEGPHGVHQIPLTTGRSLAVDPGYHAIGLPVFVVSPSLRHVSPGGFRRLMVAQDVGSAIKGPERGDIYFGSGVKAGKLAGVTKHRGNFFVLLPKEAKAPVKKREPAAEAVKPKTL